MIKTCLITAHAGCENTKANTMESLKLAVTLPCDVIEIDVRKKDGRLWLLHNEIETTKGLVSLEEALTFLKAYSKKINCDLKEEILQETANLVEKLGLIRQVVYTGSVTLQDISRDSKIRGHIFLNIENICGKAQLDEEDIDGLLELYEKLEVGGMNIEFSKVDDLFMKKAQEKKILITVWTVDEEEDMRKMAALGVYSMTTHRVWALGQILEEANE